MPLCGARPTADAGTVRGLSARVDGQAHLGIAVQEGSDDVGQHALGETRRCDQSQLAGSETREVAPQAVDALNAAERQVDFMEVGCGNAGAAAIARIDTLKIRLPLRLVQLEDRGRMKSFGERAADQHVLDGPIPEAELARRLAADRRVFGVARCCIDFEALMPGTSASRPRSTRPVPQARKRARAAECRRER
jgi:hypothetical protein